MYDPLSRREFLGVSSAAVTALTVTARRSHAIPAPAVHLPPRARPAAVSSGNGLPAVTRALESVVEGMDTLDAAVEGVKIQELDPDDMSVGYGGLPNEAGVVQLDASCMHGPSKRAGAVAAIEGIKTPSEIARLVLKYTDHIMLVGTGATQFALSYGYQQEDLLTPQSRERWLRWRANRGPDDDWLNVEDDEPVGQRPTGTINLNVINAAGDISSVTTTSGLAWKIPGRAGDSPIIGAGQYTDNDIGAAGSTGRGESNIMACGAFLTVEFMRQGLAPTDACLATLERVIALTPPRLIHEDGLPNFNLNFYAVNKAGDIGAASIFPGRYAAHDGREAALRDRAHIYEWPE